MDFEAQLVKLESISEKMREDSLSLDKSIESFEEGITIANALEKELNKHEKRVEILLEKDGSDYLEEFK